MWGMADSVPSPPFIERLMSRVNPSGRPWSSECIVGIEFRPLISRPRLFTGGFVEPAANLSSGTCQRAHLVCLLYSETQGCMLHQMGPCVLCDGRLEEAESFKGLWDCTAMGNTITPHSVLFCIFLPLSSPLLIPFLLVWMEDSSMKEIIFLLLYPPLILSSYLLLLCSERSLIQSLVFSGCESRKFVNPSLCFSTCEIDTNVSTL